MATGREQLEILRHTVECQNCGYYCRDEEATIEVKDLDQRVAGSEFCPEAECPKCGAVMHKVLVGVVVYAPATNVYYRDESVKLFTVVRGEQALDEPKHYGLEQLPEQMARKLAARHKAYLKPWFEDDEDEDDRA